MIHVIAAIEVAEGRRDDLLALVRELVPKVLEEDGCLDYGPTVDVQTSMEIQGDVRENVLVMVERWESVDALKAHMTVPHMATFLAEAKEMVQGLSLQILEPA